MSAQIDLSPRELQIAQSYASGATYQMIANSLCIAPSTVRTHLSTIYRKLEVSSKVESLTRLEGDARQPRDQAEANLVISELALSLEEAISRERALSEVLRIIGAAQGDVATVVPAILTYALELCDAEFGVLFEYRVNGAFFATHALGIAPEFQTWLDEQGAFTPNPATGLGRMASRRSIINIVDVRAEDIFRSDDPLRYATAVLAGARSFVAIPMVAADRLVGAFTIYRQTVRPFSEDATRVAQLFAAQSVIALENARIVSALKGDQP